MLRFLLPIALAAAVSACSSSDEAKPAAQAAAAPQKTMLDPQLKALQKARDVQKTVDDQNKATEKAIDDQGG